MKFSYNWLKELSGTEKSAHDIAKLLLTHAFEVEEIIDQAANLSHVVVGEVLTKEKHPDADRLNVTTVNVGTEELQIVCGAPNVAAGQKVAVALVGAVLPGDFTIKKSTIRGVESNGMICAEDELGLGKDHEGIMVLPEDAPVGESFSSYIGLDDVILEIDVLPNRAHDALSHEGMAREIAALEGRTVDYTTQSVDATPGIDVQIDTAKCARYAGVTFSDVKVGPSPQWLSTRLRALGHQSINNVVDITNYVMLETGQPLHAFDRKVVAGENETHSIVVRQAQTDEKIVLLDDTELTLCDADIAITNGKDILALAGVMGGKHSGISDTTTEIVLEVASFDASSIRKTKSRYKLDTDAAFRYERDLDPNLVTHALERATQLFRELAGARVDGRTDIYPTPVQPWDVTVSHTEIEQLLGVTISSDEIKSLLTPYGIAVKSDKEMLSCTIPTLRRDIHTSADLAEEIGRAYGYDKIAPQALVENVQSPEINEQRYFERRTKDLFTRQGYDEVRSYSFYSTDDALAIGLDPERHVSLLNPMSSEQALMRRAIAVGLLRASAKNTSYADETYLFELGRFYTPTDGGLPEEKLMLGASVTSKATDGTQFYELKGAVSTYLDQLGLTDYYFDDVFSENANDALHFHPSRRAFIKAPDGTTFGVIGEMSKSAHKYFGIKKARTTLCEVDLTILLGLVSSANDFQPLPKFPSVMRDVSLIVGEYERVADVERILFDAGGELLRDVDLFDLYINPETQERSMAFHFIFSDAERTLTSAEVDTVMKKIITAVEEEIGATVRS